MNKHRVLIVDDQDSNRAILSRCVSRAGLVAETAEDGRQALDAIAADPPDLVLLDWTMPGLSGLDVLKALRGTYSPEQLPIVMCTARTDSKDVQAALGLGANDFITKPINVGVAIARIEMQLSRRQSTRALEEVNTDLERAVVQRTRALLDTKEPTNERAEALGELLRLAEWLENSRDAADAALRRACAASIAAAARTLAGA